MWWKSKRTQKTRTTKPRPIFRPKVLSLEDRVVPTINAATLFRGLRDEVQSIGNVLANTVRNSNTVLPVINQVVSTLDNDVRSAITSIRSQVETLTNNQTNQAVSNALNGTDPAVAAQAIQSALAPYASNVQVSGLDAAAGSVTITMDLSRALVARTVSLGTGLPSLPVQLGGGTVDLNSTVRYDRLTFGLDRGTYFLNPDGVTDELKLTMSAGLNSGASFSGEIGFLQGTVDVIEDGVGFSGAVAADVTRTGVSTPRFVNLHGADLQLTAEFNFSSNQLESGVSMPKFRTDFHLDWDLSGSDPRSGLGTLGAAPRVSFDNVSIGLGSLLSRSIGPIVKTIQQLSAPLQPVLDLLDAPIPGLSDVGVGKVNLLKLAKLAQSADALPPHLQLITKIALEVATLHAYVSRMTIPGGEVYINLGNYSLTGSNGGTDLRQVAQKASTLALFGQNPNLNLTDLKGVLTSAALTFRERVESIRNQLPNHLQQPLTDLLNQSGLMNRIDALGNGIKLTFPVVDNPVEGAQDPARPGGRREVCGVQSRPQRQRPDHGTSELPALGPDSRKRHGLDGHRTALRRALRRCRSARFSRQMFHRNPGQRRIDPKLFARGLAFDSRTSNPISDFPNDLIHITANVTAVARAVRLRGHRARSARIPGDRRSARRPGRVPGRSFRRAAHGFDARRRRHSSAGVCLAAGRSFCLKPRANWTRRSSWSSKPGWDR